MSTEATAQKGFLSSPKTVAIIGCPFSGGQPKPGVDHGPIHLVNAGLKDQLANLGWKVKFDGHLQFEEINEGKDTPLGILKRPRLVSQVCETVAKVVCDHASKGELPLSLGGDHSLAMGTIYGTLSAYPDACVVYVDAHADINTPSTSTSGNIHGMPLSFLLGIAGEIPKAESGPQPFSWIKPILRPERLVYIGLRDLDDVEKKTLRDHGIRGYSMHEVDQYGIGRVVELALAHVNPERNRPIHMSFDIDALDPSVAPSTGIPVPDGLTSREGHYICEAIAKTGLLVGLDIMEVNPALGLSDEAVRATLTVGCSIVRRALGETLI